MDPFFAAADNRLSNRLTKIAAEARKLATP
jgi:hypothetical protein